MVLSILTIFMFAFDWFISLWFIKRIRKPPIKQRFPVMSLTLLWSHLVGVSMLTVQDVMGAYSGSCYATSVFQISCLAIYEFTMLLRTMLYSWEVRISQKKMTFSRNRDKMDFGVAADQILREKKFLKIIKYSQVWYKYHFAMIAFQGIFFMFLFTALFLGILPASVTYNEPRCDYAVAIFLFLTLILFGIEIFVQLFFFFRYANKFEDNFYVRREIRGQLVMLIFNEVVLASYFNPSVLHFLKEGQYDVGTIIAIVYHFILAYFTILLPLQKSYGPEFKSQQQPRPTIAGLESAQDCIREREEKFKSLLMDQDWHSAFAHFLEKEFALENLLFWDEVTRFKTNYRALIDSRKAAEDIYQLFISEQSVMQVNLPSSTRRELDILFGNNTSIISADVFDKAQEEVFQLMVRDSFSRFSVREIANDDYTTKHRSSTVDFGRLISNPQVSIQTTQTPDHHNCFNFSICPKKTVRGKSLLEEDGLIALEELPGRRRTT
jgi:hypothetical protein